MDPELLSDTFVDPADTMVAGAGMTDFLQLLTGPGIALPAASAAAGPTSASCNF
jgi:hypothetical protein